MICTKWPLTLPLKDVSPGRGKKSLTPKLSFILKPLKHFPWSPIAAKSSDSCLILPVAKDTSQFHIFHEAKKKRKEKESDVSANL